jgi:hypothetical protein
MPLRAAPRAVPSSQAIWCKLSFLSEERCNGRARPPGSEVNGLDRASGPRKSALNGAHVIDF